MATQEASRRSAVVTQVFFVSGLVVLACALVLFLRVRQSPEEPDVDGSAYLYLSSRDVASVLTLTVTAGNRFPANPRTQYNITLVAPAGQSVRWALVLSGDARFREGPRARTCPGVGMVATKAASPPFGGRAGNVDIYHGEARGGALSDTAAACSVGGHLVRPVARIAEARRSMVLPGVGRAPTPVLFDFPEGPQPIGLHGTWFIPSAFEAVVQLGDRPHEHRVDVVAPNLDDQREYRWRSPTSVRLLLGVTDTRQERTEEIVVFLVGVLGAVAVEALLIATQRRMTLGRRRRSRGAS